MAVMQGVSPEAVCDHLHGLAASMAEHFSHEEELMRGSGIHRSVGAWRSMTPRVDA